MNLAMFACSLAAVLLIGHVPAWMPASLLFTVAAMSAWELRR